MPTFRVITTNVTLSINISAKIPAGKIEDGHQCKQSGQRCSRDDDCCTHWCTAVPEGVFFAIDLSYYS